MTRFVPHSIEELVWLFERSAEITVKVDPAAQLVVVTCGPGGGYDVHLHVQKGKLHEAQNLVRAVVTAHSAGFGPSDGAMRALLTMLDPSS